MAYNQNIPQAADIPDSSQAQILANFTAIKTVVDINHVTFDDPSGGQGKHKHISFPEQVASPATAVNEVALFSRQSPLTGVAALCLREKNNGAVNEFTSALAADDGWTRLPSGILLKWGHGLTGGVGLTTVTFSAGPTIPAFTSVWQIMITTGYLLPGSDGDGFVRLNQFAAPWTTFTVWGSPRTTVGLKAVGFRYLAIGS